MSEQKDMSHRGQAYVLSKEIEFLNQKIDQLEMELSAERISYGVEKRKNISLNHCLKLAKSFLKKHGGLYEYQEIIDEMMQQQKQQKDQHE